MEAKIELVDDHTEDPSLPLLGGGLKTFFDRLGSVVCVSWIDCDELGAEEWDDCHGDQIGREESEHHCERERSEQIFADTKKQDNRKEDNTGTERGCKNSKLHLLAAFCRGLCWRLSHLHVPEDVLQHHDGIVNQSG